MFNLLRLPNNQSSTENNCVKGKKNFARGLVKSERRTMHAPWKEACAKANFSSTTRTWSYVFIT